MSVKKNKEFVRGYFEPPQGWKELNRQIQTAADRTAFVEKDSREVHAKYFAPEYVFHTSTGVMSYDDYLKVDINTLMNTRDVSYTLEDMISEGDKVVARYTVHAVTQGTMLGVPSTGKSIEVGGIMIFKLAGGKIVEAWGISDLLTLMQQIGIISPMKLN